MTYYLFIVGSAFIGVGTLLVACSLTSEVIKKLI